MFSENNKVSGRQLGRMIFVSIAGTAAFLSLNTFSKYGSDGILMIIWVYLFALVYAMGCFKLAGTVHKWENKRIYKLIRAVVLIVLMAKYLCMVAIVLNAIADVARQILIPNVSSFFIIAITLASSLYCINGGIESRGRACEILFYFVLVPILIICLSIVSKIEFSNMLPTFDISLKSATMDYLVILWFFVPAEMLLLAKDSYDNTPRVRGNVYASITLAAVVNIAIYAGAIGVYGAETVEKMDAPVLRLMQISGIPGDFLNRQDGIMSVFLIVSMFCGVWTLMYYINLINRSIFMQNHNTKNVLKVSATAVVLVTLALFIYQGKNDEKIVAADVGGMDLEERQFIMSIIICEGDEGLEFCYEVASSEGSGSSSGSAPQSAPAGGNVMSSSNNIEVITALTLQEAEEKMMFKKGGYIDYSHMKVIIMDMEIVEDVKKVRDIITEMSNNTEFAENISVCAIDMDKELMPDKEYGKSIEGMLRSQEIFKESEVFRLDKMYSTNEGNVTIPLIDKEVNLIGSGVVTNELVFWQYGQNTSSEK